MSLKHFRETPDDWLRNIFIFRDFTTRWRLRRCSRKWQHLVLSEFVNYTVILEGSYVRPNAQNADNDIESYRLQFDSAIDAVMPRIFRIIGRGSVQFSDFTSAVKQGYSYLARFGDHDRSYQVVFLNVPDLNMFMSSQTCSGLRVAGVLFVNVQVDLYELWTGIDFNLCCTTRSHSHSLGFSAGHLARLSPKQHVLVAYYHRQSALPLGQPSKWTNCQSFCSMTFLTILPPLQPDRVHAMQLYNDDNNQGLREAVQRILLASPSDWNVPKALPAGPIVFSTLPKVVTWLAFSDYNIKQTYCTRANVA